MKVKIKKLHPYATIPTYATAGAACFDLHATGIQDATPEELEILKKHDAHQRAAVFSSKAAVFNTGIAVEVPDGHVMLVFSRSGHGFKHDVRLSNCVGVIDSDYRGEVMVKLRSDSGMLDVAQGDRIAQAMIIPIQQVEFDVVEELSTTERGEGGFGSTGA